MSDIPPSLVELFFDLNDGGNPVDFGFFSGLFISVQAGLVDRNIYDVDGKVLATMIFNEIANDGKTNAADFIKRNFDMSFDPSFDPSSDLDCKYQDQSSDLDAKKSIRCPHCRLIYDVAALNCGIFRCGFVDGKQINPHLSEVECGKLRGKPNVIGCVKPFKVIFKDGTFSVEICGFV